MTTPLLLALALAAATRAEAPNPATLEGPSTPARPPAPEPTPIDAPVEISPPYGHTGWRHEIDLGAHSTRFSSKEGSAYAFHSATLGYGVSYGVTGPFLRAAIIAPLQASQDGSVYATANYYAHRRGGDLLVGVQHRWAVRSMELEAGPGLHGTFIDLPGRAGYRDFTALPLGIGVGGSLRWRTSREQFSRVVTLGTTASVAYDFRDPAHDNDLTHGFTFRLAIAVGLGARR